MSALRSAQEFTTVLLVCFLYFSFYQKKHLASLVPNAELNLPLGRAAWHEMQHRLAVVLVSPCNDSSAAYHINFLQYINNCAMRHLRP